MINIWWQICEGSIVYASAVAEKLIQVVDKQYAEEVSQSGEREFLNKSMIWYTLSCSLIDAY